MTYYILFTYQILFILRKIATLIDWNYTYAWKEKCFDCPVCFLQINSAYLPIFEIMFHFEISRHTDNAILLTVSKRQGKWQRGKGERGPRYASSG